MRVPALAALALFAAASSALAQTSAPRKPGAFTQCFRSSDYQGFKPIDSHSFVLRANVSDYYRIELASGCPELLRPQARLITTTRDAFVCNELDWDLKVGASGEPAIGCIVSGQRRLTAAEIAALPKKNLP